MKFNIICAICGKEIEGKKYHSFRRRGSKCDESCCDPCLKSLKPAYDENGAPDILIWKGRKR